MWIISRIKCDVLRKTLAIEDDHWDQKVFFVDEARALQDLAWMKDHNRGMREYMLVADVTPKREPNIIMVNGNEFIDPLDDELPYFC